MKRQIIHIKSLSIKIYIATSFYDPIALGTYQLAHLLWLLENTALR